MERFILEGSAPPEPQGELHQSRGHNENTRLRVTLVLRRRTKLPTIADLSKERAAHRVPGSTYEEVGATYGLADEDLELVKTFAKKHHLSMEEPKDNIERLRMNIRGAMWLEGKQSDIETAFAITIQWHNSPSGAYFTHTQDASLPVELKDVVRYVVGLAAAPLPQHRRLSLPARKNSRRGAPPSELSSTGHYASDIAAYYGLPPNPENGQGQCIGLLQLNGGYQQSDLDTYFKELDIAPNIILVGKNNPGQGTADLEVTLDVELVASICPKANIVIYNQNSAQYTVHDLWWLFATAISDVENQPSVLSLSWSFAEEINIQENLAHAFEDLFTSAALLGITLCASTGDTGAMVPIGVSQAPTGANMVPVTVFPASSPLVLGCGGTKLTVNPDGTRNEVVWNQLAQTLSFTSDSKTFAMSIGSSGGGISQFHHLPPYQEGAKVPSKTLVSIARGNPLVEESTGRGVPDVAANADLFTGYRIYFGGQPTICGGTSSAAPLWAALVLCLNQQMKTRVGFIQPWLYREQLGGNSVCYRITQGDNGGFKASDDPSQYWNACTGLGSPEFSNLSKAFSALPQKESRAKKS